MRPPERSERSVSRFWLAVRRSALRNGGASCLFREHRPKFSERRFQPTILPQATRIRELAKKVERSNEDRTVQLDFLPLLFVRHPLAKRPLRPSGILRPSGRFEVHDIGRVIIGIPTPAAVECPADWFFLMDATDDTLEDAIQRFAVRSV